MQPSRYLLPMPRGHRSSMPHGFRMHSDLLQPLVNNPIFERQKFMFQQAMMNGNPFLPGVQPQMHQVPGMPAQNGAGPAQHFRNMKRKRNSPSKDESHSNKKAKSAKDPTSSSLSDQYVVPVNKGSEEITMAIWEYFLSSKMTDEDLKNKLQLRKSLQSIMEAAFPNCKLYIVGSSMTGFATHNSDVDMCLTICEDDVNQKREATAVLVSIQRALRHCSFVKSPMVIRAKVPILKFEDRISGVECDLNINNTIGIRNTHLLRHYAYMDWRVRPLMLFIKHWARFHDINDASKKTISSYSLSLMLIHYLQAGVKPPVLPCLQGMRADLFRISTDWSKLSLSMDKDILYNSKNQATLGELFLGFLNYYSNIFDFSDSVISVRLGRSEKRYNLDSDEQWKFLAIEEPFERTNTARSVYDQFVFWRILRVFKSSFHRLVTTRKPEELFFCPF